jgi:hypothetical protein
MRRASSTGTQDQGNCHHGVLIDSGAENNIIGEGKVMSGNERYCILINASATAGNSVAGNYIGTDATGRETLGNEWSGVALSNEPRTTPSAWETSSPTTLTTAWRCSTAGRPAASSLSTPSLTISMAYTCLAAPTEASSLQPSQASPFRSQVLPARCAPSSSLARVTTTARGRPAWAALGPMVAVTLL